MVSGSISLRYSRFFSPFFVGGPEDRSPAVVPAVEKNTVRKGVMQDFFKQKTAYEIASGDWSSDVCSSDLGSEIDPETIRLQAVGALSWGDGVPFA